jgi:excisionase family DNA binding protein
MSPRQKKKEKREFESLGLERMLSMKEVAAFLKVHERTIERAITRNRFPAGIRVGGVRRWRRDEIEAFSQGVPCG